MTDPLFLAILKRKRLPAPEVEYRYHPVRKFRFDYAWPERRVALEVQGGIWVRGAHGRGTGIARDYEKFNLAASMGWRVLQVVPAALTSPDTVALVHATLTWRNTDGPDSVV